MSLLFPASLLSGKDTVSAPPVYTPTVDSLLHLISSASGQEVLKLYPRLHKALYEVSDREVHLKFNQDFAEAARAAKDKKAEAISYVLKIEALYNYRASDSLLLAESFSALDFMRDVPGAEVHYFYTASVVSDVYMLQGNYRKALECAEAFYEEAKKRSNSSGLVASLQTMGKAYEELDLPDKAEASFRESIIVANEKTDHGMKGESYSFLIDMLNGQKRYKDALEVNKEFEAYLKRIDAYNGELKNLCFLSDLGFVASFSKLGLYDKAWEYLSKAERFPVASTSMGMYSVENERFNLLFEEGRYVDAEQSLRLLEDILDNDASYFKAALKLKESKAELYFRWGKFDRSVHAYRDYIAKHDSLQRVEMTSKLDIIRTQYEVDKLEIQKEEQKQLLHSSIRWFSAVLLLLCVIIVVVTRNTRKVKAKNRSLLNRIHEQDKLEQRYEEIREELAQTSTKDSEGESRELIYARLKEMMKDPLVFTDPNINRKVIAEKLNTNEKYIFDIIREYHSSNVSDYLNNLRLNYARTLLAQSSDKRTIDAIALDAGFNSRSVFFRLFKEKYGMTPSEFRRLMEYSSQ